MASYPHSHHSTHNFRNPSLDTDIVSPLECSRDMEKIQRLWDETKEVALFPYSLDFKPSVG